MSALSQLRHAYHQLSLGTVKDQKQFADGLIAPAIREMERGTNPPFDGRFDTWQAACGKARRERDELGKQLAERDAVLRQALEVLDNAPDGYLTDYSEEKIAATKIRKVLEP
jgi:hypothetical protein